MPRLSDFQWGNVDAPGDRSRHPTVVEYGVREMMKKKSPAAAAKATAKKLSGSENLFLGPGIVSIDPAVLEAELWGRLVDFTIRAIPRLKEGKEDYALDGTIEHFSQNPKIRERLRAEVVQKLGRDPFPVGS